MTGGTPIGATISAERGRAARADCPRRSHAGFAPHRERKDPVEVLEEQARTRVRELVPIRYGRMLTSPFAFFRGGAAIMARDLAAAPHSGLVVQCCGDAHLSNFGVFASPERTLIFDVNDFDETAPGPFEWDVKRLAASVLIAAAQNGHSASERDRSVLATVAAYREAMAHFTELGHLDVWYARVDTERTLEAYGDQLAHREIKRTRQALTKARSRDSMSALAKLTEVVDGQPRIVDQSPLLVPIDKLTQGTERTTLFAYLREILDAYRVSLSEERRALFDQFRLADWAHKVVGVGSVGTRSWIALLLGHRDREPLFLQLKQAQDSVFESTFGETEFENHGQRVVVGQRLMQASSDVFLGWLRVKGPDGEERDYYARQLRDWKGSANVETMRPDGLAAYGRLCGWTLARAHARSGDRVAINSYLGRSDRFDRAITGFARGYAEQNQADYEALRTAVGDGRVVAHEGV